MRKEGSGAGSSMRTRWGVACICYWMNMKAGPETLDLGLRTLSSFTLFGCGQFRTQFFVLALVTHHLESALGFFVRR
jgi:hypothetical protein